MMQCQDNSDTLTHKIKAIAKVNNEIIERIQEARASDRTLDTTIVVVSPQPEGDSFVFKIEVRSKQLPTLEGT
jgi:hypothetical protein